MIRRLPWLFALACACGGAPPPSSSPAPVGLRAGAPPPPPAAKVVELARTKATLEDPQGAPSAELDVVLESNGVLSFGECVIDVALPPLDAALLQKSLTLDVQSIGRHPRGNEQHVIAVVAPHGERPDDRRVRTQLFRREGPGCALARVLDLSLDESAGGVLWLSPPRYIEDEKRACSRSGYEPTVLDEVRLAYDISGTLQESDRKPTTRAVVCDAHLPD